MRAFCNEWRVNGRDLWVLSLIQLAAFVFGVGLVCLILKLDGSETNYFNMGMLFSLITAGLVGVIYDGLVYQLRFQMALAMGGTRRAQIAVHALSAALRLGVGVALSWVLGKLECAFYALVYPRLSNEVDFFVFFRPQYLLPAIAAVVILGLFIAAIYGRFGRKGWLVVYFSGLVLYFAGLRLVHLVQDAPDSALARLAGRLAQPFRALPFDGYLVLAALVALGMLAYACHQLGRQAVEY